VDYQPLIPETDSKTTAHLYHSEWDVCRA